MKDYEVYLFDWDGTLAESHDMWFELFRGQLERYDIKATDTEISKKLFGRYDQGIHEFGIPEADIPGLTQEVEETAKKQYTLIEMFPDAREVLEKLKTNGKKLALITASYREVVDVAVAKHKLLELFDVVVCGDEVKEQKPHPDGILSALKHLGVAPKKALMAGDSPKDLLAAKNAGADSLLFFPPAHETQHSKEELQAAAPTYTIHSWRELLDTIQ